MRWADKLLLRLRSLVRRERIDNELDAELRFHLEQQIQENLAAGMSDDEANYAARRTIGGLLQFKEQCRDTRRINWIADLAKDVRYALRILRKSPGFTAAAVLSLALGIGINTAVFSLINAVLLRTLPVKSPEQLVVFNHRNDISYPMYQDLRDGNTVLAGLLCRFTIPASMSAGGQTDRITAELVSGNYFQVLGVGALIGRTLMPDDARMPGAQTVVVLSNAFWRRRFGSDPGVVGKTIRLDGHPMTVVGITPAGFQGIEVGVSPDVRVPVTMYRALVPDLPANVDMNFRGWAWLDLVGRLKDGARMAQAESALNAFYVHARENEVNGVFKDIPAFAKARVLAETLRLESGGRGVSEFRDMFSRQLWILMAAVSVVLLIACMNVASLLLARAMARQREIAVRLALGASRVRVVRQLITESVILVLISTAASVAVARWGSHVLASFLPEGRLPVFLDVEPDFRVLAFAVIVSLAAGILFGLAPALQLTRSAVAPALKAQATLSGLRGSLTLRKVLTIAQVALSLLLLEGAGLFVRTLRNLKAVDIGYDRENVLLLELVPLLNGYSNDQSTRFFEQVIERVNQLPGVRSASIGSMGLLGPGLRIEGVHAEGENTPRAEGGGWINSVSPKYFETLKVPLLLGRSFTAHDTKSAPKVAIVNQTFARRFFGGGKAVGRHVVVGDVNVEIVGVVRDGKYKDVREEPRNVVAVRGEPPNVVYVPFEQNLGVPMTLYVRTVGDPAKVTSAIRREVQAVDANVPIYNVRTLEAQLDESLSQERLMATLSSWFGAFALLLASIGLYGVLAYSVTRRTNEIGLRMALGAEPGGVIWMVLREALLLVGTGVAIGVPLALALARSVSSLLYGLKPTDSLTISAAVALLFAVAATASYLPARRASRVDPMIALRYE
ncbi:MAG TPA: ABC transporter permease [Bryobacteraceae bacterium]|nr:ABC transporter permease [Bryobacteraceae bacterium]